MLLAIAYLAIANITTILIGRGTPGWFHLVVLAEPDDAMTSLLLRRRGDVERLRLLDSYAAMPGLGWMDARVWRDCLTAPERLESRVKRLGLCSGAQPTAGAVVVVDEAFPPTMEWRRKWCSPVPSMRKDATDPEPLLVWQIRVIDDQITAVARATTTG